jgi:hypothetical protein
MFSALAALRAALAREAEANMSLSEPVHAQRPTNLPLCRGCHRPMTLSLIEPHEKYKNLDVQYFRCECGSTLSYQVPRIDGP